MLHGLSPIRYDLIVPLGLMALHKTSHIGSWQLTDDWGSQEERGPCIMHEHDLFVKVSSNMTQRDESNHAHHRTLLTTLTTPS